MNSSRKSQFAREPILEPFRQGFGCGVVAVVVFILLMVGAMGVDNALIVLRFFFG